MIKEIECREQEQEDYLEKRKTSFCFKENDQAKCVLKKSILKTKISRFKASDRLSFYNTVTNWIFSMLSLSLITLMVYDLLYPYAFDQSYFTFVQIALATMILVFSQIIANYNYAIRALKFHQVGVELSHLAKKMDFIDTSCKSEKCIDKFKQIQNEYNAILRRNENHQNIDYDEHRLHNPILHEELGECCKNNKENRENSSENNQEDGAKNNKENCSTKKVDKDTVKKGSNIFFRRNILGLLPQWGILAMAVGMIVILFR